jgi:hypothetical protein
MKSLQFIQYSPNQLKADHTVGIDRKLDNFLKHFTPKQPKVYLSLQYVDKMFGVNISTAYNCHEAKNLNPIGFFSLEYFLNSEVESNLQPLNQ